MTKVVIDNRQARHLYFIEDTFKAGLMLQGWEAKAIRAGRATFNGGAAFIRMVNGEAFLDGMTITPLAQHSKGLLEPLVPSRARKLLMTRAELNKLQRKVKENGATVVPLALLQERNFKLEIGLAKGKKLADKRDAVKARDQARDMARELKGL